MKLSAPLIYGLIACILLVGAPHADHLPLWVSAVSLMLLGWRAYLAYSGNTLPARGLLLLVTLACIAGIVISFHSLFGREVGVTLLVLLAALKLLELRAVRDATVLIYLACFIIITNFFYSQSIPTALFMLLTLLAIMTTWVHLQTGTLALKPRLRIAAIILLQAIPLSLLIFVLFPRVQGPLWGLPQDAYASSGLSDTMSPGSMSKLTLSDAVAFRVTFNGTTPLREQMYWRGPVLWDFDGRTWTRGRTTNLRPPQLQDAGTPLDYTVTLEPHNKPWLFALDMPDKISVAHILTPDFQLLSQAPVTARLRYTATSQLSYRANPDEPSQQLRRALALPRGFNPRAKQLAAEWRAQNSSDAAIVQTALIYFNRNGFSYTLEPPPLGSNSVDDFLFETRQGFCEYYASSFVFLMRAAGIPARVVTGYQGGEYNNLGGYYILRQSDAHAWAEVWLAERGWVRYDPTAAIAPGRIQNGLSASLPDNAALPFLMRTQSPLLLKLRFNLDSLANQWNQWVLGYDTERQFAFLTRLGMEDITWQKLALNMLAGVSILVGIFTLFMLRRLAVRQNDAVQAAWLKLCRKLEKAGLPRAAHEGAQDYAERIAVARPELADAIRNLATQYMTLRYGNVHDENALHGFLIAVKTFQAQPQARRLTQAPLGL
jgi:transglutaminase-like putative cysteine protease